MKTKEKKLKLVLEVNQKFLDGDKNIIDFCGIKAMVTPPLDEDYWQFRVKVGHDQAIVGFPKFHQIGIGFAKEDDWNTNLPSTYKAEQIFEHIKVNKYYASIEDAVCIKAIKMIQKVAAEMQRAEQEAEDMILMLNEPFLKDEETGKMLTKKEFVARCQINKHRRPDTFVRTNFDDTKTEIKKYKFHFLFGYYPEFSSYKYKMTLYAETRERAINRFNYVVRMIAKYGEETFRNSNLERFESLSVAVPQEGKVYGYKIPLAF
jgi:hypothetical protein